MERREKITLFIWFFLFVFVCAESLRLGLGSLSEPGPGFLSFGASVVIGLLAGIQFLKERGKKLAGHVAPLFRGKNKRAVLFTLGVIFAYPLLLDRLGFVICTLLFMGVSLRTVGSQKWRSVLVISIGTAILSYLLFDVWLPLQMPKGTWVGLLFSFIRGRSWK
jgi:putative tricarboxylic transport membrane protein